LVTLNAEPQIRANVTTNLEALIAIPALTYGKIQVGDKVIWCGLNDASLVVPIGELMLKHAVEIAGEWEVLGIIDALPDGFVPPPPAQFFSSNVASIEEFVIGLSRVARGLMGRPGNAYGMTPLMIYRAVG
jgi:hypothetical protein